MSDVYECVMRHSIYFNVEADDEEQMRTWLQTHDMNDVNNLTKDYAETWDENICGPSSKAALPFKPHFSIKSKYYPVYSEKEDITFIMKETEDTITVSGFYFGKPNEKLTEQYKSDLFADKDLFKNRLSLKLKGEIK